MKTALRSIAYPLILVLLLIPLQPVHGRLGPDYNGCGGASAAVISSEYESQVVELVNAERRAQNLPPYKRVEALDEAARYHAADMSQDNYFDHDSYDRVHGQLQRVCAWSERVTSFYSPPSWNSLAENIAAGYGTPQAVMDGWMNSSGHKANILSQNNWEIGVGYSEGGGDYSRYWVQDFGRRSGVYPLVIEDEAAATGSRQISLYIYGEWQEMRLRNDDDPWGNWQPFQAESNWTLGSGVGEHRVWAELRSPGKSASSSDAISLSQGASSPRLGNLPDTLSFTYSIPDQQLAPGSRQVTPLNVGNSVPLAWKAESQESWLKFSTAQGSTPDPLEITPSGFDAGKAGSYTGSVSLTVVDPPGVEGSPHVIQVYLNVIDRPIQKVYLPKIQN